MQGNTVAIHNILKKKTTKLNSQPAQLKKIKSTKTILEKKKKKKNVWGNIVAIYNVFFLKNYKAKFSTSSILKK